MYLPLLRLTAHKRRDKQTCGQFRLSHLVVYCAVRTCGLRQRTAIHLCTPFGSTQSVAQTKALEIYKAWAGRRSYESSILVGETATETLSEFDPSGRATRQKRGVWPEGGQRRFGDFGAEAKVTRAGARNFPLAPKGEILQQSPASEGGISPLNLQNRSAVPRPVGQNIP